MVDPQIRDQLLDLLQQDAQARVAPDVGAIAYVNAEGKANSLDQIKTLVESVSRLDSHSNFRSSLSCRHV